MDRPVYVYIKGCW